MKYVVSAIVVMILLVIAGWVVFISHRMHLRRVEEARRREVMRNLEQLVRATSTYQAPNGDFFPSPPPDTDATPSPLP